MQSFPDASASCPVDDRYISGPWLETIDTRGHVWCVLRIGISAHELVEGGSGVLRSSREQVELFAKPFFRRLTCLCLEWHQPTGFGFLH